MKNGSHSSDLMKAGTHTKVEKKSIQEHSEKYSALLVMERVVSRRAKERARAGEAQKDSKAQAKAGAAPQEAGRILKVLRARAKAKTVVKAKVIEPSMAIATIVESGDTGLPSAKSPDSSKG